MASIAADDDARIGIAMMRGPEHIDQEMRNRTEYADHRGLSCLRNTSKIL
jgi:hypothetical protein